MRKVLEAAQKRPLTYDEIAEIITSNCFTESSFYIMPYLQSGEWNLLNRVESDTFKMPITALQKSWLKALLSDRRIRIFLDETQIAELKVTLGDVSPLYENSDFHYFDASSDGDRYDDDQYIKNFRFILSAIKTKSELIIEYINRRGKWSNNRYMPLRLNYSQRDDKFRLIAASSTLKHQDKLVLNLSRIKSVAISQNTVYRRPISNSIDVTLCKEPIVLQIFQGRNALERCMLQFASMEKQTEYDATTDSYICRIFYDAQDETELLIRILSFGPVVKVLGPESFLAQIRWRIEKQMQLNLRLTST